MVLATLNVQKTGMITLPKKWRDKHPAMQLVAEDTPEGLLIHPIEDVQYYEEADGSFGLRFPKGMEMARFLEKYETALQKVEAEEAAAKLKKRKRSHRK